MPERDQPSIKKIIVARRRSITTNLKDLIEAKTLRPEKNFPLVIQPARDGINPLALTARHRQFFTNALLKHGAILFRNFNLKSYDDFTKLINSLSGEMLEYADQTSPRHKVADNIYTSTDYPANQAIFLHNENSYASTWPLKIFFFCTTPASSGGETPIADTRNVFERIAPRIRKRFVEKGWMLVRNFGEGLGLAWRTAFQTGDRAVVEDYCRRAGIEIEWKANDRLRTRQVRRAVARHPHTNETVWFNHATFFHTSTLEPKVRETLLLQYAEADLPFQTYYGDGTAIEPETLNEIRDAYRQETVMFPWQSGDVLMLDNMLMAHGRRPFVGSRQVVVGMSEPCSDCNPKSY